VNDVMLSVVVILNVILLSNVIQNVVMLSEFWRPSMLYICLIKVVSCSFVFSVSLSFIYCTEHG
jgi:hypothetical protein